MHPSLSVLLFAAHSPRHGMGGILICYMQCDCVCRWKTTSLGRPAPTTSQLCPPEAGRLDLLLAATLAGEEMMLICLPFHRQVSSLQSPAPFPPPPLQLVSMCCICPSPVHLTAKSGQHHVHVLTYICSGVQVLSSPSEMPCSISGGLVPTACLHGSPSGQASRQVPLPWLPIHMCSA